MSRGGFACDGDDEMLDAPGATSLRVQYTNSMYRRLDRRVRGLTEPADRRILHRQPDLVEQRDLLRNTADWRTVRDPTQRLFLAHRAHAARHALAARLVAEERGDPKENP